MAKGLQEKTISGVLWSVIEQFGIIGVKFILGIILARLLLPSDFGMIGMITVFFDIANELVQGGFGQAYIQKSNATKKDAATVFYFNIFISLIVYFTFWFTAPYIASFYNQPQLVIITRVMAVVVLIDAIGMIQLASIIKEVNFKKRTLIMLVSIGISGTSSIILAYKGFGVWALVCYTLVNKLFLTIGLWINAKPLPLKDFSRLALKGLFSYGSWLLLSSILKRIFENINILVIGKFFPAAQLGFYTKAKQFQRMASGQITQAVGRVAFPVFSLINDSDDKLKVGMRRFLQQILLIVIPLVTTLFVVSYPFVKILLTDKWLPMVPYLRLFCIIGAVFPINAINIQVLVAQGYSRKNFKITLIKNTIRILNVVAMYRFGVLYILIGETIISGISLFINTYYTRKHLKYGIISQLYDLRFHYLGGLLAIGLASAINRYIHSLYMNLIIGALISVATFFIFQYIFNKEVLEILFDQKSKLANKLKR